MRKHFLLLLLLTLLPLAGWAQTAPTLAASPITWDGNPQQLIVSAAGTPTGYTSSYTGGTWYATSGSWPNITYTFYNDAPAGIQYYIQEPGGSAPTNGNSGSGSWQSPYTPAMNGFTNIAEGTATAPGTYTVWYRVMRDHQGTTGNYQTSNWTNAGQVTIKIDLDYIPHYVSGPQRVPDLVYNDEEQTLITAGTQFCDYYDQANGGVEYVLKTTHAKPTSSDVVLTTLPKAKDAGTYYVYYRVLKDGGIYTMDSPWNEVGVGGIEIAKRDITADDFTITYGQNLVFNNTNQLLVTNFEWTGGIDRSTSYTYTVENPDGSSVTDPIAQGFHAGDYKIQLTITGDANHNNLPLTDVLATVNIAKADYTPTVPVGGDFAYNGTLQGPLSTTDAVVLALGTYSWDYTDGRIEYKLGDDGTWTTDPTDDVLKATNVGSYTINYRTVEPSVNPDNADFNELSGTIPFTISKVDWAVTAPTPTADWEYDAKEYALTAAVTVAGKIAADDALAVVSYYVNYTNSNGDLTEGAATTDLTTVVGKDAGEYEIFYSVAGTDNYNAVDKTSLGTVTVSKHGLDIAAQSLTVAYGTTVEAGELVRVDPTDIPADETLTAEELAAALAGFKDGEFKGKNGDIWEAVTPIPSDAGEYKFVLEAKDNNNYEINDFVPNGTLTITKIDATAATVAAATLEYDGTDQDLLDVDDTAMDGVDKMLYYLDENGEGVIPVGDARWSEDIPTGKNAGDYTVFFMAKGDKNHNDVAPAQVDVTIAQKALTDAMFELAATTAVYTGGDLTPAFTAADGDPSILVEADFTVAKTNSVPEAVTEMVNVDTYTFTFEAAADGNYTGTITKTFEITQKELAASMFALSEDVTYTGAPQQPTITAADGDPSVLVADDWNYEIKDGEGNVVAIDAMVNADTYTFRFFADGGNYKDAAEPITIDWTIGQKALTADMFELASYEETYDGTDQMPDFTFADGTPSVLAAADFTVATTNSKPEAVTEMVDADTYTFTFTAAADGNYKGEVSADFVINKATANFVDAEGINLTYNAYDQALVTKAETDAVKGKVEYQVLSGEEVLVDWTEDYAKVVGKDAGEYFVKVKFTASEINYTNPEVVKDYAIVINKATIGYSLSNLEKTWNGEPFDADEIATLFTLTAGGDGTKLFGDDEYDKPFTLSLPEDYRDAGTYTFKQPKVEFKEGYPVNYNVNFTGEAEVVINKADIKAEDYTAPAAIAEVYYTGEEQDIVEAGEVTTTYQYPEMEEALPIGKVVYATTEDAEEWSETAPKGTEAGGYTVYFKIAGDKNHNDSDPILIEDVEIIQATLTADFLPETYETELPYKGAAYEASDFIPALVGIEEAEGYEVYADEMKDAGDYVILFQGINNYQGSFEVPVKVTPIDVIAVAPKGIKKVYDGTASLEGVVTNDDITFVGTLSGEHITVPEALVLSTEGIAVSEEPYAIKVDAAAINAIADNKNYNILEETIDGTLTITKAPAFKVGFDAVPTSAWTKKFGEDDPELTGYTVAVTDGEFFDDIADVLAATTAVRAEGEDVDTYDVTLEIDATAEVFANYEGVEFDGTAAQFEITKSDKVYTVSVANMTETYKGEAFETAITIAPEDLVIAGYDGDLADFFTTLPTATIPADAITVGDYNITLAEGESQNFNFTFVPATFTIEPFEVTEATIENQQVVKGKELDVTLFTVVAPDADLFYVTAPGLVDMDDIVTGEAGVYKGGLVIAVDESVADNYTGLDKFTADLDIVGIADDAVVLADNEDFVASETKEGVDVTFASRTLNAGNWNVIALPFEATVAQISNAFGYAAVDILDQSNAKTDEIHFMITTSGSIPAYTPFIVKTTSDEGLKKDNFDQVVFNGVTIEAGDGENKAISDAAGNQFIGTFKAETKIWGEKYRYMAGGAWYNAKNFTESNPAIVKAFRGYIEMVSASARIFIEEPDGTVTAIDAVNFNKAAAEGMYNLSGMKINNTNRKSVVIENGKKVIK